jgi:hypothetical protein
VRSCTSNASAADTSACSTVATTRRRGPGCDRSKRHAFRRSAEHSTRGRHSRLQRHDHLAMRVVCSYYACCAKRSQQRLNQRTANRLVQAPGPAAHVTAAPPERLESPVARLPRVAVMLWTLPHAMKTARSTVPAPHDAVSSGTAMRANQAAWRPRNLAECRAAESRGPWPNVSVSLWCPDKQCVLGASGASCSRRTVRGRARSHPHSCAGVATPPATRSLADPGGSAALSSTHVYTTQAALSAAPDTSRVTSRLHSCAARRLLHAG